MSVLLEIVRNVIVIVMVASFLEILLPEGKIKPFVRFAIGLFIIVAVLNPTLSLLFSKRDFSISLWDYQANYEQSQQVLQSGIDLNHEITARNSEVIKNKIQEQIGAVAMLVPGVQEVQAEVEMKDNGLLTRAILVVTAEKKPIIDSISEIPIGENPDLTREDSHILEKKIIGILRNLYGLEGVDIKIEFKGG